MSDQVSKPLNWQPDQDIGYTVERRPDGGMHITFIDASHETLAHWREFALEHLLGSDRLTRNLYDLRSIDSIPEEAIQYALEVNSDPAARNIRMAILVSSDTVRQALEEVQAQTTFSTARIRIFTDPVEAEDWLGRDLSSMV